MTITRQFVGRPASRLVRAWMLGMAIFLVAGFGLASWLKPDPQGFGTHQQLGLPPCSSRLLLGIPCPGCGMTTSFAHFVRGEFSQAARANLVGTVLAAVCALLIPWCIASAWIGRYWLVAEPLEVAAAGAIILGGLALLLWIFRLSGVC